MDEINLIRAVQHYDNRNAFAFLVRRYQAPLRAYLRHMCGGQTEWAEELSQEVFLRAYSAIKTFKAESKFSTWLFVIARNLFWDAKKYKHTELHDADEPNYNLNIDASLDLHKAMRKLPHEEREVLVLSYVEGLTHEEIAVIVKSPAGTVKSRILQAKQKLSSLLLEVPYEKAQP